MGATDYASLLILSIGEVIVDTECGLREACRGVMPLDACLEDWMVDLLSRGAPMLQKNVVEFGSPINVIHPATLQRNVKSLQQVADQRGVAFQIFFARKANKCLSFVDAALEVGAGVDVASENELHQVLKRRVAGSEIVCTAAVKSVCLIQRCLDHQVTLAVDNGDELERITAVAARSRQQANIALRIGGFVHAGAKLHSRFGFDVEEVVPLVARPRVSELSTHVKLVGIHFHLDGYCGDERVSAVQQSLVIIDELRRFGHRIDFLDIGGGLPMNYLQCEEQWCRFWIAHKAALLANQEPLTYRGHGLGFSVSDGKLIGTRHLYPFYQRLTRDAWLARVLDAEAERGDSIAEALKKRHLQLRTEPGRSLLEGSGLTVARVEFRKRHHSGYWFIGVSMNRTQCRTSSDDFLVDPLLIRASGDDEAEAIEGFLVGAYCTESELLSLRKLQFPAGVRVGDLIVFPNTAGYFMHFLESRSHQFPLAKNLVLTGESSPQLAMDEVDRVAG